MAKASPPLLVLKIKPQDLKTSPWLFSHDQQSGDRRGLLYPFVAEIGVCKKYLANLTFIFQCGILTPKGNETMRNSYCIGTIFFPGMKCNERFSEGNQGRIVVGGDRGDVDAPSALNSENDKCEAGVALADVSFLTTLDLNESEIEDEVRKVVEACYDSIKEETFTQSKMNQ